MIFEAFRGRDLGEALARVRAAYGADALIASTRVVSNGRPGKLRHSFVEVSAAPPDEPSAFASGRPMNDVIQRAIATTIPPQPPSAPAHAEAIAAPAPLYADDSAVKSEIRALRGLVEELSRSRLPCDRALSMLESAGIESPLATELLPKRSAIQGDDAGAIRDLLRQRLRERITVSTNAIKKEAPCVIACVGPAGSGKTTTLAKLAARAKLDLGRSVSIVTLDTYRVGAVEQMRRYAEILEAKFEIATDAAAFARFLDECPDDIVFIDTPSRAPSDAASLATMVEHLRAVRGRRLLEVLLTVPAGTRGSDAERIAADYASCAPTGVVITKLDETDRAGGALHAALRKGLPLAYLCDGPRVPEDLHVATVERALDATLAPGP